MERSPDVGAIARAHHQLPAGALEGPASAMLRSFSRVSQDVDAALHHTADSPYHQRLALRAVAERLDSLLRELTRSDDRYALRFRPIATRWRQLLEAQIQALATAAEQRQEIDSPYVIGVPLTAQQEIFVGRTDISARIEDLLLDPRHPPLLLYGQRRMGKTSLLNNLGRLLPSTVVPLFVDLQGPIAQAPDHHSLLYNLARAMGGSARRQRDLGLPALSAAQLARDPFTAFDEWLDAVELLLAPATALLLLDEFETLEGGFAAGRLDEAAVLGMLRHLVQHRPAFKVLLAGSHTLDEVRRWTSYLINVQVIQIGHLRPEEARQLVERPVKDFALRYEPAASQAVLDLTAGHPYLVQLLCREIVMLKNQQPLAQRRLARPADIEAAVVQALAHGALFFEDIAYGQVDARGRAVLAFVAGQAQGCATGEQLRRQFPEGLDATLATLRRRELLLAEGGRHRFQIELIRRWFAGAGIDRASG